MKKILYFTLICAVCICNAESATRAGNTASRGKATNVVTTNNQTARSTTSRNAVKTTVSARGAKNVSILTPRMTTKNVATRTSVSRTATRPTAKNVTSRAAATTQVAATETRTGAEYEQCKTAFFTCMDQFCQLKNDNFRRCSCNDRVYEFQDIADTYQKASEKLTEFSEDLDVVGMTREQALAMKKASEGEDALTEDKSASKQLLQAIMNSINGGDTTVGGKYKDLNSVTISADISNAFGMDDSGQIIASYNGATLYKAVYPKCRNAVAEDCNKASLQRAVNAYLMAIEQDCNSVESALAAQQKTLKASTHQSSAMLDLARVENRRNHNADDVATCLANVETAIKSEEVCGAGYHKCLDNGQFIDVTTGAPLTGVSDFYKLETLLTFKADVDLKDQKLSSIQNNLSFVQFFENKTKKFAKDALDKCSEDADYVWQQYVDKALLDIYYAQKSKVKEIKQSCFDLVAKCYDNQNTAIEKAMANLTGDSSVLLRPEVISLTTQMCTEYIESCDNMFVNETGQHIIQDYLATKDNKDSLNACRAIAQQCFDSFGGTGYNNFYSPQSGLFTSGKALDWFSLYDETGNIVSPCAKQIAETSACNNEDNTFTLADIFGGFNKYTTGNSTIYSAISAQDTQRTIRSNGVATEIYYKILDNLSNHCSGLGGYFIEYKDAEQYGYKPTNLCLIDSTNSERFYINPDMNGIQTLVYWYHFYEEENMCPAKYGTEVDTQSWGLCSCWENGGYRSKNGQSATCRPIIPAINSHESITLVDDIACTETILCGTDVDENQPTVCQQPRINTSEYWCQQSIMSSTGQLCPTMTTLTDETDPTIRKCAYNDGSSSILVVEESVPAHKNNK